MSCLRFAKLGVCDRVELLVFYAFFSQLPVMQAPAEVDNDKKVEITWSATLTPRKGVQFRTAFACQSTDTNVHRSPDFGESKTKFRDNT
jgi:hypothetical protein